MQRQKGAALVVSLVLLSVALMLGLSNTQSSRLEEAMSGNARSAASAKMAAEYAISRYWQTIVAAEGSASCGSGPEYTFVPFIPDIGWESLDIAQLNQHVVYRVEYCHGASVYRVRGVGAVLSGNSILAQRTVEAQVIKPSNGFLGLSPITIPSPLGRFSPASSNAFDVEGEELVDGTRNPAISTASEQDADAIEGALSEDRLDNYLGGISSPISESLLTDASKFSSFVELLRAEADVYYAKSVTDPSAGSEGNPQITFIDGDFNQGRGNFSGSGIMVVNGNADLSGTPSFEGLLIVLGNYTVSGGGRGVFSGALLVSPYEVDNSDEPAYISANLEFSGGGNATYLYNAASLDMAYALLDEAGEFWSVNNESQRKPSKPLIIKWSETVE
ncbi:PilX N-terminal domain-containing pilus assembly protein [Modicisalibacter luteus]|uniref:PilX N-terminal domain-containing pilus assembly protein n=1 Tax=Modicisalibacter luteus TaxID=453962 RepID=A0ABV7LV68_9GAMM|nr:PilX N-terminal domain-containing pilus assembly protein [Halomonas lutea]